MSDPSLGKQGESSKPAWPAALYLAAAVLVLGCGVLVRTIGESTVISNLRSDTDTLVYDRHGVELGRFHSEINMVPVTLEDIAPILIDAVLVPLDPDYLDIDKAEIWPLVAPILDGDFLDRPASVTQLYLRLEDGTPSSRREAFREASKVIGLERSYPREALLEQYLSRVPLGRGAFGVEAAAMSWYGLSAKDLGIGQAAHLASRIVTSGLPLSSERSSNTILTQLYEAGLITNSELISQRQILLEGVLIPERTENPIKPFVADAGLMPVLEEIYQRLVDQYGQQALVTGDVVVISTIDLDLQKRIARIADEAKLTPQVQRVVVIVLDDRNQLRAAYGTDGRSVEDIRVGPLQLVAWVPEVMDLETSNLAGDVSVLQLAELHSLIARNGSKYKTEALLEISNGSGQIIDRLSHQVLEIFDSQLTFELSEGLDDLLTIDENIGIAEGQVRVRGKQGADAERGVVWYGGTSARFTVALQMSYLPGESMVNEEIGAPHSRNGRETVRIAGNIFSELHSDG